MIPSAQGNTFRKTIFPLLFLFAFQTVFGHKPDSTQTPLTFSGAINLTNNGFSNIPTFSLGRPATIVNLTVGRKRTSFEPELRFSLEGKPWSFLFWLRHKVILHPKYQLSVGIHPGFNFRYEDAVIKGVESNYIVTRRYLTEELNQNFIVSKQVSMSLYYMYGRGIDVGTTKNTHYLSLRAAFSNLKIAENITLRLNPQVFYLKTDDKDGFFAAASLGIMKKNWPISIGAMMNQKIKSTIVTKDFNWNVGLNYVFGGKFKKY